MELEGYFHLQPCERCGADRWLVQPAWHTSEGTAFECDECHMIIHVEL